jgi:hypothetical protein
MLARFKSIKRASWLTSRRGQRRALARSPPASAASPSAPAGNARERVLQKEARPFLHNEMKRGASERDAVDRLTYALWIPARHMPARWHPSRRERAPLRLAWQRPGAPQLDRTPSRVEPDRRHHAQRLDRPCASVAPCLSEVGGFPQLIEAIGLQQPHLHSYQFSSCPSVNRVGVEVIDVFGGPDQAA